MDTTPAAQLRRISTFSHLPEAALQNAAAGIHTLIVPSGRMLIATWARVPAYLYLLKGCLATLRDNRQIHLRGRPKAISITHFYPGCRQARTLTRCWVMRIEAAHHQQLCRAATPPSPGEQPLHGTATAASRHPTLEAPEPWLRRFLESPLLQKLSKSEWQRLFATLQPQVYAAGSHLVSSGQPGVSCYVIRSGHAMVQRYGRTVAHLGPGDLCGEDALILEGPRNADVVCLKQVSAYRIKREPFMAILLATAVRNTAAADLHGNHVRLQIDNSGIQRPAEPLDRNCISLQLPRLREQIQELPAQPVYLVCGGSAQQRALAAFLAAQRGLQVYSLAAADAG